MSEQSGAPASPPDPIAEPQAYQEFLLAALGDDDPATVQAGTPAAMRQLVSEAGLHLRTRPAPGEWSALEAWDTSRTRRSCTRRATGSSSRTTSRR